MNIDPDDTHILGNGGGNETLRYNTSRLRHSRQFRGPAGVPISPIAFSRYRWDDPGTAHNPEVVGPSPTPATSSRKPSSTASIEPIDSTWCRMAISRCRPRLSDPFTMIRALGGEGVHGAHDVSVLA